MTCIKQSPVYKIQHFYLNCLFSIQFREVFMYVYGQRHAKRDLRTLQIVYTEISPYTIWITAIHNPIAYTAKKSVLLMWRVSKLDAAAETRWLVWVYTFCICPKVPFSMTLAIYNKCPVLRYFIVMYQPNAYPTSLGCFMSSSSVGRASPRAPMSPTTGVCCFLFLSLASFLAASIALISVRRNTMTLTGRKSWTGHFNP